MLSKPFVHPQAPGVEHFQPHEEGGSRAALDEVAFVDHQRAGFPLVSNEAHRVELGVGRVSIQAGPRTAMMNREPAPPNPTWASPNSGECVSGLQRQDMRPKDVL
jgi:hypothetical protein